MIVHNSLPELEEENIDKVIHSYEEELSNENLLELNQNQYNNKVQNEESEKPNEKVLIIKRLS